jgi:hypothetical protein
MQNSRVLFIGTQKSGKTTFTAALWYFLTEHEGLSKLRADSMENCDHLYLNAMRDAWLRCEQVQRTNSTTGEAVTINIVTSSECKIVLQIPDFSGETFENHFVSRKWSKEYDVSLNETDGIVLFVNPNDKNLRPNRIVHQSEIIAKMGGEVEADEVNSESFEPWDAKNCPTQVKLVDLLQLVYYTPIKRKKLKISVVVSAYDCVDVEMRPSEWLCKNLPLLWQYLKCNADKFDHQVYGVSAQGGDYDNPDSKRELLSSLPLDRPFIKIDLGEQSRDLSLPIRWLAE